MRAYSFTTAQAAAPFCGRRPASAACSVRMALDRARRSSKRGRPPRTSKGEARPAVNKLTAPVSAIVRCKRFWRRCCVAVSTAPGPSAPAGWAAQPARLASRGRQAKATHVSHSAACRARDAEVPAAGGDGGFLIGTSGRSNRPRAFWFAPAKFEQGGSRIAAGSIRGTQPNIFNRLHLFDWLLRLPEKL